MRATQPRGDHKSPKSALGATNDHKVPLRDMSRRTGPAMGKDIGWGLAVAPRPSLLYRNHGDERG